MDDSDAIKMLPGDLREVAELIGLDNTFILIDRFGGGYLNIPKCEAIIKEIRNKKIRADYDSGKFTLRQLAWKQRLTIRQIQNILSESDQEIPLPLLELMEQKKEL